MNTITFTTVNSGNYSVVYSTSLIGSSTAWPIVSGPVAGDGGNHSLTHATTDASGFYRVVRTP